MQFAAFLLDKYGAPKLSQLTACGASAIDEPPNYLGSFVLNAMFMTEYNDPFRRLTLMFGRRVEHAIREYIIGRQFLLDYLNELPQKNNHFLVALRATTHFEQCIASAYEATLLMRGIIKLTSPNSAFPKQDEEENLRKIWNRSKHFDQDLTAATQRVTPDITAPVWLTNEGIECTTATITFRELETALGDLLANLKFVAEDLPRKAAERRQAEKEG
jgi:hypothetical protein